MTASANWLHAVRLCAEAGFGANSRRLASVAEGPRICLTETGRRGTALATVVLAPMTEAIVAISICHASGCCTAGLWQTRSIDPSVRLRRLYCGPPFPNAGDRRMRIVKLAAR